MLSVCLFISASYTTRFVGFPHFVSVGKPHLYVMCGLPFARKEVLLKNAECKHFLHVDVFKCADYFAVQNHE